MTTKYKADNVWITVAGVPLMSVAEGTFIEASWNNDDYELSAGAYGDQTRSENLDKSGEISVTLKQTSPSNQHLIQLNQSGILVPCKVADISGNPGEMIGVRGVDCSVEKADFARADSPEDHEYVIKAAELKPMASL